MRKIIGFKIELRPKEIARKAKKSNLDISGLDSSIQRALKHLKPAVLFDSFPAEKDPEENLSPLPGLAFSLALATLGESWDEQNSQDPLYPVLSQVALEEAVRFVSSLVAEEALQEKCELSPVSLITDPSICEEALKRLNGFKIGVSLLEGKLTPPSTLAFSVSWIAKTRKTKGVRS